MAIDIDMAAMAPFARDVLEANQRPGGKNSRKGMATATENIPIISGSCVNHVEVSIIMGYPNSWSFSWEIRK